MSNDKTLSQKYFDNVYADQDDPWRFASSEYEWDKYTATLAALPKLRYARAFEIGCSIGVLTAMLAPRCDSLLAVDISEAALESASQRLAVQPHVELKRMAVPHEFPDGKFDLVMLSEVGYYWSSSDLEIASRRIVECLRPGGSLVLVHWTPDVADYPQSGDAVHAHFLKLTENDAGLQHVGAKREATYRLDVFERASEKPA